MSASGDVMGAERLTAPGGTVYTLERLTPRGVKKRRATLQEWRLKHDGRAVITVHGPVGRWMCVRAAELYERWLGREGQIPPDTGRKMKDATPVLWAEWDAAGKDNQQDTTENQREARRR